MGAKYCYGIVTVAGSDERRRWARSRRRLLRRCCIAWRSGEKGAGRNAGERRRSPTRIGHRETGRRGKEAGGVVDATFVEHSRIAQRVRGRSGAECGARSSGGLARRAARERRGPAAEI